MNDYYILQNRQVVAVPHEKWSRWIARPFEKTRRVGKTQVGEAEVSTVFLGIDHNWLGKGPPIVFETMIFGSGSPGDYQWRYSTWEQAEAGHNAVVAALRKGTDLPQ